MPTRLNGWRRLAIILTAGWLALTGGVALLEWFGAPRGMFVREDLAPGIIVDADKATLPDGRVVALNARDPQTGRVLPPWEIDWAHQPGVPTQRVVLWSRLLLGGVGVPVGLWLLFEIGVFAARWVIRGFK